MALTSLGPATVRFLCFSLSLITGLGWWQHPIAAQEAGSEESQSTLPVEGSLVDFEADVWPIIEAHCLECHGPDDAKNDFRMDDPDMIRDYVEPGEAEYSTLWIDYMATEDPDMRMPPVDHSTLTGPQMATFRQWIVEGAKLPEEMPSSSDSEVSDEASEAAAGAASIPATTQGRVWLFQGLFHPASVHFPVALLAVSSVMVLLSFLNRSSFEPVAFHCLWIGAFTAVAACITGWSYAQHEGYGAGASFNLADSAIDRHRWMGIGTAIVAFILLPMAVSVRRKGDLGMRIMWLLGSFLLLGAVSFAGYQGGELTYGEDHYQKEFERLFPNAVEPDPDAEAGETLEESTTAEAQPAQEQDVASEEESTASTEQEAESAELDEPEDASQADADSDSNSNSAEPMPTAEEPSEQETAAESNVAEQVAEERSAGEESTDEQPTAENEEPASEEDEKTESSDENSAENQEAEDDSSSKESAAETSTSSN